MEVVEQTDLPDAEKIELLLQVMQIHSIVYGDALCDRHFDFYNCNMRIVRCYIRLNNHSAALDFLEKALENAEKFMTYTDGDCYESLMVRGIRSENHSTWSQSPFDDMRDDFETPNLRELYDPIRDDPRFAAIVARLNAYERQ